MQLYFYPLSHMVTVMMTMNLYAQRDYKIMKSVKYWCDAGPYGSLRLSDRRSRRSPRPLVWGSVPQWGPWWSGSD